MHPSRLSVLSAALLLTCTAHADEGMWTFDAFPTAKVQAAYGSAPDQAWLDRVRNSAVRLTGGCSASVVSSNGLVLTNHHCVVDCAQALSTEVNDLVKNGFVAAERSQERKCPGQQAEIVTAITDVTAKVKAAIGNQSGAALVKARDAAIAGLESQTCTNQNLERCQVVTLFGGGEYKLYRYRKYADVRLAFAPEFQAAFFGGDPDNFNFPRYALDGAFLRLYENDKPATTPVHLTWSGRAPKVGEVTYVVGNPGSTQRLYTQAQLGFLRDVALPATELLLSEWRGRMIAAMDDDAEKTRTGSEQLFSIENSYKAYYGRWQSLLDKDFANKLAGNEQALRSSVANNAALKNTISDPWAEIENAVQAYRSFYQSYTWLEGRAGSGSELFQYARNLVRAAQERAKPDAERLPEYTESRLALLKKELIDARPIYPWLEQLGLTIWLSKSREFLTVDAPQVQRLLGKESPEALAKRLVSGTRLADASVRAALYDGGLAAVQASTDPLIQFVLKTDADARAVKDRYRAEYDGPVTAAQSRLAQARFATYGNTLYPDATFTLRISYGAVQGWTYQGTTIAPTTVMGGYFQRATGATPFDLPAKLAAAESKLDKTRVLDFVTTNDIIGGNSGSPVVAADGSVIGAAFDGNIHSLGGAFGFDATLNRTIVVSTGAIEEALTNIYPAPALLKELRSK
ncbi:MAG: S46 family peptidase [Steroidobacteraceae bacterium]